MSSAGSALIHAGISFSGGSEENTTAKTGAIGLKPAFDATDNWIPFGNCSPGAIWEPGFDFDSSCGVFVLFGRFGPSGSSQTWTYDLGTDTWKNEKPNYVPNFSPDWTCMVFDKANGKMIMHGGRTWTYNVTAKVWTDMNPSVSPGYRRGFSMVYDIARGEAVLFGGINGSTGLQSNDTWSYNLSKNTWTERTPANPPPGRAHHSMAYDSSNKVIVLFGGETPAFNNETWIYDMGADSWTKKNPAISPPARSNHAMAFHQNNGETVLFGGNTGDLFRSENDTWTYNLTNDAWTNMTPGTAPGPRYGFTMAYDSKNGEIVLVGGVPLGDYNWRADSWSYNLSANNWTMGTLNAPSARAFHDMAYDSDRGEMVLFGGWDGCSRPDGTKVYCGDTWTFNTDLNRWMLRSPRGHDRRIEPVFAYRPSYSAGRFMAYDSRAGEMVLYNSRPGDALTSTFSYNLSTNNWTNKNPTTSPPAGLVPTMVYNTRTGEMMLQASDDYSTATWKYNLTTNTWTDMAPSTNFRDKSSSMIYIESTGEVLLFTYNFDTRKYDFTNNTWTRYEATEPPKRQSFSIVYDNDRNEVIRYGGYYSSTVNDTWCLNLTTNTWSEIKSIMAPPARYSHTIVYDKLRRTILLFGGTDDNAEIKSDNWIFDMKFYCDAGNYTSPIIDTRGTAFFGDISWGAILPEKTKIGIQFRSGATSDALINNSFTGPDGKTDTFFNKSGEAIPSFHNKSRWMQYRVFMNTSNKWLSPLLESIKIRYNLLHNVTITSPNAASNWTGQRGIAWKALDPDSDTLFVDIYLIDKDNKSTPLKPDWPANASRYDWDTNSARTGMYRIRIVARDDNRTIPLVAEAISPVFNIFHPNHAPAVQLLRPDYASTVNSSSVRLEWNGSDEDRDPLKYYVFLGFEEFYLDSLPDVRAVTNETGVTVDNLTNKATYFWSVIADDGKENSTLPSVFMFRVDIPPPPPPNHPPEVTLVEPADGATVTTMSTQLSWTGTDADRDKLTYFVFLAEVGFNLSGLPPVFARTNETTLDTGNITNGTTYYWAVIANDSKENGTGLSVWKFTVHVEIPPGTPRIIGWSPKGPRTPLNPAIQLSFDREMVSQSVFSALVFDPPVDIGGFESSNDSVRFNFTYFLRSPLAPETTYNATVGTGAKSISGKNLFWPFRWSFTTLSPGEIDRVPPTIVFADPPNGATSVDRWKNITIMFSEAMALAEPGSFCSITPNVAGSWQWMNNRTFAVQFRPSGGFANGTYKLTITTAARDEGANPLDGNGNGKADGVADDFVLGFTVGVRMTGNPRLLTRSLAGEGVRTNAQLVLAFDRQMDAASVLAAFRISPSVEGNWTYDEEGKIFTFTPVKRFRAGTAYHVTVTKTAADVDGNPLEKDVDWSFTTASEAKPAGLGTTEWLLLALAVIVVAGVAALALSRRKKAAASGLGAGTTSAPKGFAIEDIFLMYNDGRLIQHTTRRIKADMDVDIFTSMLTALQAFVKDSMGRGSGSELGSMEFGGDKILLEKGKFVIIAVVITGGEPAGFREEMKAAVRNVESEYGPVLEVWEGDAKDLAGAKRFLSELGAYKVAEEKPAEKPKADISLKSEVEFYQGFVRLKVAAKNNMTTVVTKTTFKLIYNENMLRLDHIEPALECKGDEVVLGILEPQEKKTMAFFLDPQICTESFLEGVLTFKDAHGNLETIKMPRKLTSVVCPILFTEENINTAMLKRMAAEQLDRKDSKVFTIPATMTPEKAFEIGKAAVQHHDVRLVREFKEDRPFRAEAWYYGKAKGRPDKLVVRVRIIPEMSFLEFLVSSDSVLMLTGMLAELKTDLNKELESHKLKGAMKQVTDRDDIDAVAEIRAMLEKAGEDGGR